MGTLSSKKGFTLIELLIVVAILGVIAIIAIPIYVGARTDAARNEARSNLTVIYGLEHQFRNEYNTFVAGEFSTATTTLSNAPAPGGNIGFRPGNANSLNYRYVVDQVTATAFRATAIPVRGPVVGDNGCTAVGQPGCFSINQDNVKTGPW